MLQSDGNNFRGCKIMIVLRREIFSISLCFLGCLLLVPSCILLIYPKEFTGLAIPGLIIACLCLTASAVIDLYEAYFQLYSIKEIALPNKTWQVFYTKCYQMIGAGFFLAASIMYLPSLASKPFIGTTTADLGTWVFRFGSFAYLGSSYRCLGGLIKSVQARGNWLKQDAVSLIAICAFILGSLFYIFGGVVGQMEIGPPSLMPELWVIGSLGFAVGSFIFFKKAVAEHFLPRS